jgi:hypothetical protein
MTIGKVFALCAAVCAALVLTGCFVVSKNLPAGQAVNDERLIGTWMAVDEGGGTADDSPFLHFQKPTDAGRPLRLVWVEDNGYQVYDLVTLRIGAKHVFAAKLTGPEEVTAKKEMPTGYYLGFYEVTGTEAVFQLLDSEKIGALIGKGAVKGIKPPRKYDFATLTGSPQELARFLASPQADAARVEDATRLRRVHPPLKK